MSNSSTTATRIDTLTTGQVVTLEFDRSAGRRTTEDVLLRDDNGNRVGSFRLEGGASS